MSLDRFRGITNYKTAFVLITLSVISPINANCAPADCYSAWLLPKNKFYFFESDSRILNKETKAALLNIAPVFAEYPCVSLTLEGSTGKRGDEKREMSITRDRVDQVAKLLISAGVAPEQISPAPYGSIFSLYNEANHPRNENVRIRISENVTPECLSKAKHKFAFDPILEPAGEEFIVDVPFCIVPTGSWIGSGLDYGYTTRKQGEEKFKSYIAVENLHLEKGVSYRLLVTGGVHPSRGYADESNGDFYRVKKILARIPEPPGTPFLAKFKFALMPLRKEADGLFRYGNASFECHDKLLCKELESLGSMLSSVVVRCVSQGAGKEFLIDRIVDKRLLTPYDGIDENPDFMPILPTPTPTPMQTPNIVH